MSNHTHIAFHLPKWGGGKWHLPYWGTAISEDHAACRLSTMLKTGINDHRIYTTLAEIRAEEQNPNICNRCAKIAVSRAAEAQVSEVTNATAKPAKITSTVTLPDGRVETRTGKNAWPFAVCSPGCHADGWGVLRWSRTRQAAEKFQAWCNAQGAEMIVIETEVG